MRGRPVCPTGQKKNSVGATGGSAPLFYKERLGTGSPPHPTRLRRPTFPPRGRLWGWEIPCRVSHPLPSNGLARQGTPSRSGRQPAKTRRAPPAFPSNAPRPVGHASQSFPARRRGKKIQSCFDRLRRPKHTSHPESASFAGAGRGASPNFGSPAQRVPKFLPFPARPAGGRAVTGVRYRAAGQAEKKRGPLAGS